MHVVDPDPDLKEYLRIPSTKLVLFITHLHIQILHAVSIAFSVFILLSIYRNGCLCDSREREELVLIPRDC